MCIAALSSHQSSAHAGRPPTSAPGPGSSPQICTGTGPAPATSAQGLGSPLPHLRRDPAASAARPAQHSPMQSCRRAALRAAWRRPKYGSWAMQCDAMRCDAMRCNAMRCGAVQLVCRAPGGVGSSAEVVVSLDGAPSAPIRYAYAPRRPRAVHAPSTRGPRAVHASRGAHRPPHARLAVHARTPARWGGRRGAADRARGEGLRVPRVVSSLPPARSSARQRDSAAAVRSGLHAAEQCGACGCLTRRASVMAYVAELSGAQGGAFCGPGTTRPSFCESSPTGFRQRQPPPPFPSTRSLLPSTGSHSAPLRFGRGEPRHICTGTAPAQAIAKPSVLPESDMGLLVSLCGFLFFCVFACVQAGRWGDDGPRRELRRRGALRCQ
jgi:hypothetical protein